MDYFIDNYCINYYISYLLKHFRMKKNMGSVDRVVRTLIALLVGGLYFSIVISGTLGIVLLAAAVVFLLTSVVSFCPLYTVLGVNTCAVKN
jgi:uncharacterized phage-like protein YoqJ